MGKPPAGNGIIGGWASATRTAWSPPHPAAPRFLSADYDGCVMRSVLGGLMGEVAYRSEVRGERVKGPLRRAYLPAEKEPVLFSTDGPVAVHYKAQPGTYEPHATTLDYVVAATAG